MVWVTVFTERRKYQRCTKAICRVLLSTDKKQWSELDFEDISAGGLSFKSKKSYDENTKLYFNITIYNAFSEFNMSVEGVVIRKGMDGSTYKYGIKFTGMNKYSQIQLDEIIKAKTSLQTGNHHMHEDGIYAFMFIPKVKKTNFSKYR